MSNLISSDDPFSAADKADLSDILAYMIPAEGHRPGADDPAILADFLVTVRSQATVMHELLTLYRASSLDALSQMHSPPVNALVSFAVQCYYRDDRVMADLEMEARPPHPIGYELEQGDWSLLDPVRQRGKVYRDAD